MRWFRFKRRRTVTIEEVVGGQLKQAMQVGVHNDFQAGYVAALSWTWEQAGLPPTPASIALQAMAAANRQTEIDL